MDLDKLLEKHRLEEKRLEWEGSFGEYLDMVIKNLKLARLSHARIYDMIMAAGTDVNPFGERQYKLFSSELFGVERAIESLVEYFASAARRLEIRKRMLLLVGPPSTGKSTIVALLKRGLEAYSRTDEGTLYAIKGCPMQEEPLHLIPEKLRTEFEKEYGIYIEGDLCPHCRYMVLKKHDGKVKDVLVKRGVLGEQEGIGIGTYVATEIASQDISRLVGSMDMSFVGEDRIETAGMAYRLDGELNIANRGIMEFIEMFKADELFLTVLVSVTQEQTIKMERFGTTYADEVIIAHSNEAEYNNFVSNAKTEALQDRIILVRIPYNLRVRDEVRIYEKLLRDSSLQGVHFAPLTLRVSSTFAVLSRLEPPTMRGMSLLNKLKLYDGELVSDFTRKDAEDMMSKGTREGMKGISPRYVVNQLANMAGQLEIKCIDPMAALEQLGEGLEHHIPLAQQVAGPPPDTPSPRDRITGLTKEEVEEERLRDLFYYSAVEYSDLAKKEILKAFSDAPRAEAAQLLDSYLVNVAAYCTNGKVRNPTTGEESNPSERAMRQLEEAVQIREGGKDKFRQEIYTLFSSLAADGKPYDYKTHDLIRTAIEKKILPEPRHLERILVTDRRADESSVEKRKEIIQRLIDNHGYCSECAERLLNYVAQRMQEGEIRRLSSPPRPQEPVTAPHAPPSPKRGLFRWLRG